MPAILRIAITASLFAGFALPALAAGDPAKGEKVFRKCAACHAVSADAPAKPGPNLQDVVGRLSGSLPGFKYSDAMLKLNAEGHVWTPEEIGLFAENPKKFLPGTKMTFAGLKKPEERADLVAYLISLHPGGAGLGSGTGAEPAPAAP